MIAVFHIFLKWFGAEVGEVDGYSKYEDGMSLLKNEYRWGMGEPFHLDRLSVWKHGYGNPCEETAEILFLDVKCTWTWQLRLDNF
jgi:hypothetical protein